MGALQPFSIRGLGDGWDEELGSQRHDYEDTWNDAVHGDFAVVLPVTYTNSFSI